MNGEDINKSANHSQEDEAQSDEKKKSSHSRHHSSKLSELEKKCQQLEESLRQTAQERDEIRDRYLRSLADIDNTRKRLLKDKEEYQKYALSSFLLEILPVYDNLERAVNVSSDQESAFSSGIKIILKQFLDILKKNKVVEIEAQDKPFNPEIHQAIAREERTDIDQPTVVEVYQKGFIFNDRLLRPAIVKVALPAEHDTMIEERKDD